MTLMNYPPPPPPPPPSGSSKHSSKTVIAALIIVLALVIIVVGYYASTLNSNNGVNPSPSASHSPSATSAVSSSPSATPYSSALPTSAPSATASSSPSGQASLGYRVGAWANYSKENYDGNGGVTANYDLGYSVDEGIIRGVDCWLLQTELKFSADGNVMKTVTNYWLDKSSLQGLHYKIVVSSNGLAVSTVENDYSPGDVNDIPTGINLNAVISKEPVVVPAGTFNCDKASTTTKDLGNTYVTTVWGNSNIPVVGIVKQELTENGVLISSTELVAYGG